MTGPGKGDVLSSRYRLEELLGEGAMGRVWRATDVRSDEVVAVKIVKVTDAGDGATLQRAQRFEREAETLRRLAHPDILRYVDHGRDRDVDYLVVELLDGAALNQVGGHFRGDADRVLLLGARLARAFAAGHAAGVIHRDVKPGNIHLTANGEPRVLDFGLARWVRPDDADSDTLETVAELTRTGMLLGTVPYMSPEQLRGEAVDRTSDIFSLAVVLWELVAGHRPFGGGTVEDLYRAMEEADPAPLGADLAPPVAPSVGALDAVLRRALQPVPGRRFRTMDEFAEALDAARDLSWLPRDASVAVLVPPLLGAGRRPLVTRGRETEVRRGVERIDALRDGAGSVLIVEGPTGIGKTQFVDELIRLAHAAGCLCLVASAPAAGSENGPHPAAAWLRRGHDVFPELAEVSEALALFEPRPADGAADGDTPSGESTSPAVRRGRGRRAVAALTALASRMPLVLVLEEAHQSGPGLLRIVERVAGSAEALGMMLVLTRRTDVAPVDHLGEFLARVADRGGAERLELDPLPAAAIGALVGDAYPGAEPTAEFVDRLAERTGGNPGFTLAILEVLERDGALTRRGGDWTLAAAAEVPELPVARSVAEVRFRALDPDDLTLLETAAVLGERGTADRLAEVLGLDEGDVAAALRRLDETFHLLVRDGAAYRFDQRVTRDAARARVDPERRRQVHRRAAESLAERAGESPAVAVVTAVATHFVAADEPARAYPWSARAGRMLLERDAAAEAIPWLERCMAILESGDAPDPDERHARAATELALGEALFGAGRHDDAQVHLERARVHAADAGLADIQARSLILLSRDYLARGDLLQSERRARDAERISRRAHLDVEQALSMSAEAHALSRSGDAERAAELWTEASDILETSGRPQDVAEIRFRVGNQRFRVGRFEEARDYYERALEHASRESNPRLFARLKNALGGVGLALGAPSAALPLFREALEIRRAIGANRGAASTQHNIAFCHYFLGQLEDALAQDAEVMRLRRAMDDSAGFASAQRNRAHAMLDSGDLEGALREAHEALTTKRRIEDLGYLADCLVLVGEIELIIGRPERARNAFREILRDHPDVLPTVHVARLGLARADWLAGSFEPASLDETLAALSEMGGDLDNHLTAYWPLRLLADAGDDERLRRAAGPLLGHSQTESLPHATLAQALGRAIVAERDGDRSAARDALDEAVAIAERVGMPEWTWRARAARAASTPGETATEDARGARATIECQAARFTDAALRTAYLAERSRRAVIAAAPDSRGDGADTESDAPTRIEETEPLD